MVFKKKHKINHKNQDFLVNPHRLGRNTVKPMPQNEKSTLLNGGYNRRIDDFNRPNGYHSSLPNLNLQIKAEKAHAKSENEVYTNVNQSTDLSSLLEKSKKTKHEKPQKHSKNKFRLLRYLLILLILFGIGLIIYLSIIGKINIIKLILN